jgi:hypothetical protein
MQIFNRSIKLTGTEKQDIWVAKSTEGIVIVVENRGPGDIEVKDIGAVEPNRFVVIGSMDEVMIHPPSQFATVDITVFTK